MNSDKKNFFVFVSILALIAIIVGSLVFIFGKDEQKTTNMKNPIAIVTTTKGIIKLELFKDDAPKTVDNFVKHSQDGYYNNLTFHRAVKDFIIQSGDPKGDGTGGESIYGKTFNDELNTASSSYKTGYVKGILAMANSGPNTNGSQFFITVADDTTKLQKNYTIFGKVTEGQDVADAIGNAPVVDNGQGEVSKPVTPIKITKIDIQQ